jgi:Tol biopolymer transport system component
MFKLNRIAIAAFLVLLAALPASAGAAPSTGAIVFSMVKTERVGPEVEGKATETKAQGGLYAAKDGHFNQLTEDPTDSEPSFSADGHTIAFVRADDVWAMRADGTGQKQLTSGVEIDARPLMAPNGRYVLFTRRGTDGAPRDLYTVAVSGGTPHPVAASPDDEHEASFSPDGRAVAFVRSVAGADDLFVCRPSGARLRRLTRTAGIDEFAPRDLGKAIVYSRGESTEGPSAYADIYAMEANGRKVRKLIAGAGSSFVEDATANGRTLLFRRDQGLWVKRPGHGGRKLAELPDQSRTNAVFSSDGRKVAAFVATEDEQSLSVIDVATGRRSFTEVAVSYEDEATAIGPVIAWQPVRR